MKMRKLIPGTRRIDDKIYILISGFEIVSKFQQHIIWY